MGEELGWSSSRKEKEFDDAIVFLRSMGMPEVCFQLSSTLVYAHMARLNRVSRCPMSSRTRAVPHLLV